MSIYIGPNEISSLKKGTSDISEVYVGGTKVRPSLIEYTIDFLIVGGGGGGGDMNTSTSYAAGGGGGGGGAGAGYGCHCGGNGGSGVVVVRYMPGTSGINSATGGSCCYSCNGYCIHVFNENGTFSIS